MLKLTFWSEPSLSWAVISYLRLHPSRAICQTCSWRNSVFFCRCTFTLLMDFFLRCDAIYLPGLRRAGSTKSGRFVAPMTNKSVDLCKPSNSANSCDTTLKWTSNFKLHWLRWRIKYILCGPYMASTNPIYQKILQNISWKCFFQRIERLTMIYVDQEVQPSPFMHWLYCWLIMCTLGLCIVNVYWCRNSDGFCRNVK